MVFDEARVLGGSLRGSFVVVHLLPHMDLVSLNFFITTPWISTRLVVVALSIFCLTICISIMSMYNDFPDTVLNSVPLHIFM